MVAGVGLEPHGLRVMSPTSYQLLYPAIYVLLFSVNFSNRTAKIVLIFYKTNFLVYNFKKNSVYPIQTALRA